ncbi:MAG: hypothetical protein CMH52_02805 [Myxococcales bacterium]|nr:hypothetical protein [Myxococcales bacterium]|tara:strand:+ start:771 stop:1382 length:612 start_codon:yes stop_codon:yes gene_type:complete
MTDREHELLNRFLDGELTDDEASEFEEALVKNPDLINMRDDFTAIGSLLREHVDLESTEVDFSNFASIIDERIDSMEAAPTAAISSNRLEQVPIGTHSKSNLFDGVASWFRRNWTPVLLGAAAAAAVAFFTLGQTSDQDVNAGISSTIAQGTTDERNVVVDSVSNEGQKAVLVSMPAEDEESTVIWLLDDEKTEEPLDGEDPI